MTLSSKLENTRKKCTVFKQVVEFTYNLCQLLTESYTQTS